MMRVSYFLKWLAGATDGGAGKFSLAANIELPTRDSRSRCEIPNCDGFDSHKLHQKLTGRYVMNSNTVVWADLAGWLNVEE